MHPAYKRDVFSKSSVLLASQPIYSRKGELFGTELLFRSDAGTTAMDVGENVATSEVLVNHCSSITSEVEHLQRPAFINVSADFLLSEAFLPCDPRYIFIELVERIAVTPEFVEAVKSWKSRGFRFALDDFEFTKDWDPLLELADVVKMDVLGQDPKDIADKKKTLTGFDCLVLAERIETLDEYNLYVDMGFDLFQGYFLSKPKEIRGKSIRPDQSSTMDILRLTTPEEPDIDLVAQAVERDPHLSLQMLKLVNSPLYSLERPIESIKEAVVFLGLAQLRKWAMVLSLLGSSENSREAQRIVLVRAKFCELYAKELGYISAEKAFMIGLLSGIDLLLEIDPKKFVTELNLSKDMVGAILYGEGKPGKVLKLAVSLERLINMNPERIMKNQENSLRIYHDSFHWAENIMREFLGGAAK